MASNAIAGPVSVRLPADMMTNLSGHLFRSDLDEHGAVIGASVVETERGMRLLGRRLFLAQDTIDYVPGERGYRMLTPEFVRRCVRACAEERLAYLAVHNHAGTDTVAFSGDDMASHRRGYPALLDILDGPPAGALVFAMRAAAGDIWLTDSHQVVLDDVIVTARTPQVLLPKPRRPPNISPQYDRQVRLFGDRGQDILATQKVGIVGAGGVGSLLSEYLSRLGVGHLVVIDPDRIEYTNCSRLVGARSADLNPRWIPRPIARLLGCQPALKVKIAERVAHDAQSGILFDAVNADIMDPAAAELLVDCDAIFLAADTMRARLVVNAICHQYLVPVWQAGTKVQTNAASGAVDDVFSVVRHIVPGQSCMWCSGLIDQTRLAEEGASPQQQLAQRYIEEVPAPSVITLNAVAAAYAVDDYLFTTVGLTERDTTADWIRHHPLQRHLARQRTRHEADCTECVGRLAAGRLRRLPVRAAARSTARVET